MGHYFVIILLDEDVDSSFVDITVNSLPSIPMHLFVNQPRVCSCFHVIEICNFGGGDVCAFQYQVAYLKKG